MAKPNSIIFIEDFREIVWQEIIIRFGDFATPKDVIYHLAEKGLIEPTRVRNYLIIKDFDKFLVKNKGHVTHTFMDLSIKYNLSDRQVQGIVYKYRAKFEKEANIKSKKDKRTYTFKHKV